MQNFTPIGQPPAEKSVTVHKKQSHSKLSIQPYTTYGGIIKTQHHAINDKCFVFNEDYNASIILVVYNYTQRKCSSNVWLDVLDVGN